MLAGQYMPDDDVCPVRDELLGQLYSASTLGLHDLVATVPPTVRAMLALFCYHRSHLHSMGLAIAASCDEDDLVRLGGRVGTTLFTRSREAPPSARGFDDAPTTAPTGPASSTPVASRGPEARATSATQGIATPITLSLPSTFERNNVVIQSPSVTGVARRRRDIPARKIRTHSDQFTIGRPGSSAASPTPSS